MDLLTRLKEDTTALHKSVELVSGADKILDHSISYNEYQQLLQNNYCAYLEVETRIAPYLHHDYVTQTHQQPDISTWILRDLQTEISPQFSSYTIRSAFETLGALYVLEGSLLGGMLLAKHLAKCSEIDVKVQRSFHASNAYDRGRRWKDFKTSLASLHLTSKEREAVVNGAITAFSIFQYHLAKQNN